jgi:hypothetical protein
LSFHAGLPQSIKVTLGAVLVVGAPGGMVLAIDQAVKLRGAHRSASHYIFV